MRNTYIMNLYIAMIHLAKSIREAIELGHDTTLMCVECSRKKVTRDKVRESISNGIGNAMPQ